MRVLVDNERCQGHGRCHVLCPAVFDLDDEGFAVVKQPEVPAEAVTSVRSAVSNCPEGAISLTETS